MIKKVVTTSYLRLYCDECNMCLCTDGSGMYISKYFSSEHVEACRNIENLYLDHGRRSF